MDLLKKLLVVAFYILIVVIGIAGFLAIRSVQGDNKQFQPDTVEQKQNIVNS